MHWEKWKHVRALHLPSILALGTSTLVAVSLNIKKSRRLKTSKVIVMKNKL